jgi:ubiquinone/menaquinone biosynthesis C-methylase UbiE/uncharacterized protein YbaR (Trm112 family)
MQMPREFETLHRLLACPACGDASLAPTAAGFSCAVCGASFPLVDSIPWLFPEPAAVLGEWRGRLHLLLEYLAREASACRRELEPNSLHDLTRQRLRVLAHGHEDQAVRISELLAPLGLQARQERYEVHLALGTRLPNTQGLTNYYANIHRDWCWGGLENHAVCELVAVLFEPAGPPRRLLVLGAGAGRLAYDLHQSQGIETTVALDFNPLLAMVGRRVSKGEVLSLYEFPIAPRSIADHAILRKLAAPVPARAGLSFILGDALAAPLAAGAFDAVLTPWFVDIVPEDLPMLMRRVNRLLAPDGNWLFLGSLAWADRPPSQCYSLEELLALAPSAGFAPGAVREQKIPYMDSPASRHARVETIIAFAAEKRAEVVQPGPAATQPAWLNDPDLPVPALPSFREQSLSTRVYAFIMAMIDGRRSIHDMAALMEEQKLMPATDAVPAIRQFLARMLADANKRANF